MMREDLIGRSRRAAVKREKELRQRFLSSEDGAEHDVLILQALRQLKNARDMVEGEIGGAS